MSCNRASRCGSARVVDRYPRIAKGARDGRMKLPVGIGALPSARCSPFQRGCGARQERDVLEGRRADLPGQVPDAATSRDRSRRCRSSPIRTRGPGRGRSASACRHARCRRGTSTAASACRSSRTTCRSPTSRSTPSSRWVDQGAPQGNPADMPPPKPVSTTLYWQAERDGYGPPDIVVKSGEQTMPALHQDEWWRPLVDIPDSPSRAGCGWSKSGRRTSQGRKILHHSIAYQVLNPENVDAVNTGTGRGFGGRRSRHRRRSRQPAAAADGMGDRQGLRPVTWTAPAS